MSYSRSFSQARGLGTAYDEALILGQRMRQGYAGYRGFGSLGDALSDYQADHAAWATEKAAYDQMLANWQATKTQLQNAYNTAMNNFNADHARWAGEVVAYQAAQKAYQSKLNMLSMTYGMSQSSVTSKFPNIAFPAGYPGCVTQAQKDAWQRTCDQLTSVKGFGLGALPTGPECGLALLPVCQSVTPPAPPRAEPMPPAPPQPPAAPPPLRPEPMPPAPVPTPVSVTLPTPPAPTPQNPSSNTPLTPSYQPTPTVDSSIPTSTASASKSGGLLSNGLLLIVLAGGGYALYRTFKKPKATAA